MKEQYLEKGFNNYLSKPIDGEELNRILNKNLINKKKKVLLVDDNKLNNKILRKLLEEYNFQIEEALSGEECLSKVENDNKYDIIFMDYMMLEMDGIETLRLLKENSNFNSKVIVVTAGGMNELKERILNNGFDDYIAKPVSWKILE